MPFYQFQAPATRRQSLRAESSSQAGSDHDCALFVRKRRILHGLRKAAAKHFAFVGKTGKLLHCEAGRSKPSTYRRCNRVGRERCVRRGQARQFRKNLIAPHLRIFCRGETIEKKRIGPGLQLTQHPDCVSEQERQRHPSVVEVQAMKPGQQWRIALVQCCGHFLQLRITFMDNSEFRQGKRMFLHGHEMQARAVCCGLPERSPRGQKIQPRAKSGFNDRETVRLVPAVRQPVALQENVLRLLHRALRRGVDVVELRGIERAVDAE